MSGIQKQSPSENWTLGYWNGHFPDTICVQKKNGTNYILKKDPKQNGKTSPDCSYKVKSLYKSVHE